MSTSISPSVEALRARFGDAIGRAAVIAGDTVVYVAADRAHEILAWLKTDPEQAFDYLTDITAVEYRDPERPIELVYQLRSLRRRADLRVKVELEKGEELRMPSVYDLWRGADWLEREVYDMFGVTFTGHPDLRRILMWETYTEGYPLRKDFPLRGQYTRAEQTRQALTTSPEAHYSTVELAIARRWADLPEDTRDHLAPERQEGPA
ncbi:MAG: NADH-quinone oxidoreductase subunit C [Gemmatimonadota bacterium]